MELLGTFERGWEIRVEGSELETRLGGGATIQAWLAALRRVVPAEGSG
jgi:hypothetical protein